MKAWVYEQYGTPDVLDLQDVAKPNLQDSEVLVKIHAASLNPAEWHNLVGENIVVRAIQGMRKPKNRVLGADLAGEVVAVGKSTIRFQPGDRVYGRSPFGGFAEYVALSEEQLAPMPNNLNFLEAAAVPLAAITALQGLRKGKIERANTVLVNGASGGIGTMVVQIAKTFGVEVTGVCSTRNVALVRSLGANHTVDYTQEALGGDGRRYDLVIDNVGNLEMADFRRLLNPNGIAVIIGFETMRRMLRNLFYGTWRSKTSGQTISIINAIVNHDDLRFITSLIEDKKLKPVIDKQYRFDELPDAMGALGKKRTRGKLVVSYPTS